MQGLFPAGQLVAEIPESLQTPLFNDYIKESQNTQRFGVIGLLEEFHSYYFKARFYLDMLEAFKSAQESETDGFLEWVRYSQGSMNAFYEFDFFIQEYLLYMKKHHHANYNELKSHKSFVEAYATIRVSYEDLVNQYLKIIKSQMQRFNESGQARVEMENNVLWIRVANENKSKGAKVLPQKDKLIPVLTSDRYGMIMSDFRGI